MTTHHKRVKNKLGGEQVSTQWSKPYNASLLVVVVLTWESICFGTAHEAHYYLQQIKMTTAASNCVRIPSAVAPPTTDCCEHTAFEWDCKLQHFLYTSVCTGCIPHREHNEMCEAGPAESWQQSQSPGASMLSSIEYTHKEVVHILRV
jgi:hypothetical protein